MHCFPELSDVLGGFLGLEEFNGGVYIFEPRHSGEVLEATPFCSSFILIDTPNLVLVYIGLLYGHSSLAKAGHTLYMFFYSVSFRFTLKNM